MLKSILNCSISFGNLEQYEFIYNLFLKENDHLLKSYYFRVNTYLFIFYYY